MKLATTTEDFINYFSTYEEKIKAINDAGFSYIDISLYKQHLTGSDLLSDDYKDFIYRIKEFGETLGVKFVQAHSPGGNPLCRDANWDNFIVSTIRSFEACEILGIPNIVVHAGVAPNISKEETFEKNLEFMRLLFPIMEKTGVNLLVENDTGYFYKDSFCLCSGSDIKSFIEYVDHPLVHACWDTGHANIEGHQYQDIIDLGEHLYALHINDNGGKADEHTLPYQGTVSMDEVMQALIKINYKGYFTFESVNTLRNANCWYAEKRNRMKEDNRLLQPPLAIKEQMEKVLYNIGVHILEKYNVFEK